MMNFICMMEKSSLMILFQKIFENETNKIDTWRNYQTRRICLTCTSFTFFTNTTYKINLMMDNKNFDVIIIGGSYAGLSSAMTLGRALRNVLMIDSGKPCNRQTPHSH